MIAHKQPENATVAVRYIRMQAHPPYGEQSVNDHSNCDVCCIVRVSKHSTTCTKDCNQRVQRGLHQDLGCNGR